MKKGSESFPFSLNITDPFFLQLNFKMSHRITIR